jgi:hypothetical protein
MTVTTTAAPAVTRQFEQYDLSFTRRGRDFTPETGARIVEDLQAGMPDFNVRQYFGTQPTIFEDYDHLALAEERQTGRVVGLLGSRWLRGPEIESLYLWTAMVVDDHRRSPLFRRLSQFFFEQVCENEAEKVPSVISTKSYNPVVYKLLRSFFAGIEGVRLYPEIPGPEQKADLVEVARAVARTISPTLVLIERTGVVPGGQAMVAPDFFPRMDRSTDDAVNDHFAANLSRADQVLCVLTIAPHAKATVLETIHRAAG